MPVAAHMKPEPATTRMDANRGYIMNTHNATGINIYMYVDEPGIYRNQFEKVMPESLAAEAGFPVEKYRRERVRKERLALAQEAIDAELAEATPEQAEVVATKSGYTVEHFGAGHHNVKDPDGNLLNSVPLTQEIALKLLDKLVEVANKSE